MLGTPRCKYCGTDIIQGRKFAYRVACTAACRDAHRPGRSSQTTTIAKRRRKEVLAARPRPETCEVCGNPPSRNAVLSFDHDHATGAFRGWLCHLCNSALGHAGDNPAILSALAAYLERNTYSARRSCASTKA